MAPKRKSGSDDNTSPQKISKTKVVVEFSAAPALHPTLQRLKAGMSSIEVQAFMSKVKPAKGFAGIEAFDTASFKSAMKQSREYTCILAAADVDPLKTTHANIIPAWGSLEFDTQHLFEHV